MLQGFPGTLTFARLQELLMETTITASEQDRSMRLDVLVARETGITRSQVQKLMQEGHLLVNGKAEPPGYRVRTGDVISVQPPTEKADILSAESIPLAILHADAHLVVVDKPAGLVVYPSAGHERGTLMNAI